MASTAELNTVDGLVQLSFLVQNTLARRASEHDLSIVQMRLLGVLRDRVPTMNELAKLLELDKSSVTGLVDRAERRGLVDRNPAPHDRRATVVRLSVDGRSLASVVATQFETDVVAMLQGLRAADRTALTGLVSKLLIAQAASKGIDLFSGVASVPVPRP
jgi:MarR family transcriptional regulator, lower aerobic nicotinate degradation pathway regulator